MKRDVRDPVCADEPPAKRQRVEASDAAIGMHCRLLHLVKPTLTPIAGTIKHRITDFTVREIPLHSGTPVVLSSVDVPRLSDATSPVCDEVSAEQLATSLAEVLSAEQAQRVARFVNDSSLPDGPVLIEAVESKEKRSLIHKFLRRVLGHFGDGEFFSETNDDKSISVFRRSKRHKPSRTDPSESKLVLHFVAYKENIDSTMMLRQMAMKLGIGAKQIQFSGTKDKRAVTLQQLACPRMTAERLAALNGTSFGRNALVKFGNFSYSTDSLTLGRLAGNFFSIVVRPIDAPRASPFTSRQVDEFAGVLRSHGAINYFGHQRFGTTSILTSDVGAVLLQGNYRAAVSLILSSKAEIVPEFASVVGAFEAGDLAAALRGCPHFCPIEHEILKSLEAEPTNYERAILTVPRPLAMLYCHSVQSLAWNVMASRRLQENSCSPMAGDLVFSSATDCADVDSEEETAGPLPRVSYITEEDIKKGVFGLQDVVLPVPGPDPELRFPNHDVCSREAYVGIPGVCSLLSASSHLTKRFHFHGTYRRLIVAPKDLQMKLLPCSHRDEDLVITDWMKLCKKSLPDGTASPSGKHALLVEFSLPAGSYATSVLREFCDLNRSIRGDGDADADEE